MARQYSVTTNMLTTDETVMIDGKVSFSRISRKMNAKEIEAENARRRANGNKMSPLDPNKPYSYIEMYDVTVRTQNPNAPRLIETYISEHCYVTPNSKTHPGSNCFMAKNSGNGVPTLCILQPDGVNTIQHYLTEGEELAAGLQVSILCKVFDSKNSPNKGLALETVIITDPRGLVLYERAATAEAMAAYGYTYTETPKPVAPAPQVPQGQPAQAAPQMPQQQTAPQVQPQATNNFSYVPQGQPVAQPAPQIPQGQPVQVAQPQAAPQVQPQQFVPGNAMFTTPQQVVPAAQPMPNNSAFMAPPTQAVQPQAAPQATVPQGQPVPQGTGINYDPNDNRTY